MALLAALALSGLALSASATGDDGLPSQDALRAAGQAIYRDGVLADGRTMAGASAAGVVRTGRTAACVACHRRSGFGAAEGQLVVPPITAQELFQERKAAPADPRIAHQLGGPRRPPYDGAALARAIREGLGVDGRQLNPVMPRYALGERDMAALAAYLKTLFAAPDPGVDAEQIRLATVIQPGVAPSRRQAMLEVLQAFVRDKNAAVRSEQARRRAGGMRMHRAWRTWVLDVWQLEGASAGWGAQLEQRYRNAPVFALVAGIGDDSWQPIADFSERQRLPCILPQTLLPGQGENFYTVYFSSGVALEARALAGVLAAQAGGRRIIQVARAGDPASLAAAAAFADAFRVESGAAAGKLSGNGVRLDERVLEAAPDAGLWQELARTDAAAVVLWLRAPDLARAVAPAAPAWLSASLLDGAPAPSGPGWRMTYPWELPGANAPRVRRSVDWLRARAIGGSAQRVAIDTHYALAALGDALAHQMDSFSRDYLVETVEHQVSTTLLSSSYPPLTLGPDQRFASKGVYLVRPAVEPGAGPEPLSALIVP
jgi:cytochrome c553